MWLKCFSCGVCTGATWVKLISIQSIFQEKRWTGEQSVPNDAICVIDNLHENNSKYFYKSWMCSFILCVKLQLRLNFHWVPASFHEVISFIPTKQNRSFTEKVTASSFCRKILLNLSWMQEFITCLPICTVWPSISSHMVGINMFTNTSNSKDHFTIIFYFFRNTEDFVVWVDSSKVKLHLMNYDGESLFRI